MKKAIALLLAVTFIFAFTGCGNNSNAPQEGQTPSYASAEEVLTKVWDSYGKNETFPTWGGNAEAMVDGAPGTFDLSKTEELTSSLVVPEAQVDNIDDAASLMHGMNLNTFTAAAFHVKDVDAFSNAYAENLKGHHWMCGFPEEFVIIDAGSGYVITAFGSGDLIGTFSEHATKALDGATISINGPIE